MRTNVLPLKTTRNGCPRKIDPATEQIDPRVIPVSEEAGNNIVVLADGLYAGNPRAEVEISGQPFNLLSQEIDGLFADGSYIQPGAGAVRRGLAAKTQDFALPTVEDYGAVGDGVANDLAAMLAMHAALGYIRLQKKTYRATPQLSLQGDRICIYGAGKPAPNANNTALVDGTGSIIIGTVFLRASYFELHDFGNDVGDTRGFGSLQEGFVFDARANTSGVRANMSNVASMGPTGAVSSHGMLNEGFESGDIRDIDIYNHNYGLVLKSRNFKVRGVRGVNVKVASVYLKSSLPAVAGDVQSGLVNNIEVTGVISTTNAAGSPQAPGLGVWVHAEGVPATNVKVSQVYHVGGRAGFRATADGTQYVAGVMLSDLSTDSTILGWEIFGTIYECQGSGFNIVNPSSAQFVQCDTATRNWQFNDITLVITSGTITDTQAAILGGIGSWDNLVVRNNVVANMTLSYNWANVRGGRKQGNVVISGEGTLPLQNGAVAAAGEVVPRVDVRDDNAIALTGGVGLRAATSQAIAALGGGLSFGPNRFYNLVGRSGSAYRSVPVIVSGTTLTVLDTAYTDIDALDLSGVIVHR